MNITTTWKKMEHGTPVYMFAPGRANHSDGILRDGIVNNDPNDDNCAAFGAAIAINGRNISLAANVMIFDSADDRDAVANEFAARAAASRAKYNAPEARDARAAKLDARDAARDAAAIRHELSESNSY